MAHTVSEIVHGHGYPEKTGLVRVQVQPPIPSCRYHLTYAEETTHLSIYVDRRVQLPVSKWYLIDLILCYLTDLTI